MMEVHDYFSDFLLVVLQMAAIFKLLMDVYLDIDKLFAEFVLELLPFLFYFL